MARGISARTILSIVRVITSIFLSIIFYILVIIMIAKLCGVTYDFMYQIYGEVTAQEVPGVDVDFIISEGESTMSVASRLEYNRIVVNKYSFYVRAQFTASGSGNSIIPGTYELNTSMTYEEILAVITDCSSAEMQGET